MGNIKIHKKERIVVDVTYETTDGRIWDNESVATHQQLLLDGVRKVCPDCHGLKGKYEDHGDYGYTTKMVFVNCKKCNGKGYLELKFA